MVENIPPILREPVLVMQQRTSLMGNDFAIEAPDGQPLGNVKTQGNLLVRFVLGSRSFELTDPQGMVLLRMEDQLNFLRDSMRLFYGNGELLARIRRRHRLLGRRISVEMLGGGSFDFSGNFIDLNFEVVGGGVLLGQVSRQWGGMANMLMDRSRYALLFEFNTDPDTRLAVIGTLLALDVMRAKSQ